MRPLTEEEVAECRAHVAPNCDQEVQIELVDEDTTFRSEGDARPTFVCDPCWRRAMEFSGAEDATMVNIDEAVRDVQEHDRNA